MRLGPPRPVSPRADCPANQRADNRPHAPRCPLTSGPRRGGDQPNPTVASAPRRGPSAAPGRQTASAGPRGSKPRVTPRDHSPLGPYLRGQQLQSSPARRRALPSPSELLDTPPSASPLRAASTTGLGARRL
ncbi:hypothetical protein NDU88_005767 [Pleurodeles waltl]|uniref:Uncharacterized protein n=1 Tax=Pleurodeles waltl TaxID=8319 RepID=A0AAV7WAH7_PLEWA|nr:hypothetical protein NDU88_005767 [Pleurodeles waltl]